MPALPRLSVIMPQFGCESYVAAAVQSILQQSLTDLELLVIDDASPSDDWLKMIQSFRCDPRLRIFRATRHAGPYRIRNSAVPLCRGTYLAFQDADDISAVDRLALQLEALERSGADIMGCGFRYISEDGTVIRTRRMLRAANFWLRLGKTFSILPGSMVLPRAIFEALGGFDGTTDIAADTDFILRAAYRYRIRNVSRLLYDYRVRQASLTQNPETGFFSTARRTYVDEMWSRENQRSKASEQGQLERLLKASANDICFDLIPI